MVTERAVRIGSWVVVGTCVVLLGTTLAAGLLPNVGSFLGFDVGVEAAYNEGELIDLPADVYHGSSFTIVAFVRSSCSVCRASEPALRGIAAFVREDSSIRMIVATSAAESERQAEVQFGGQIGVSPADVVSVRPEDLRLKWVPSLLLVDRTGRILKVHEGLIDSAATDDWIGSLKRLMRS